MRALAIDIGLGIALAVVLMLSSIFLVGPGFRFIYFAF